VELPATKKIALVNIIIKFKQTIPIKVRQVKQFVARDDGMNIVMIGDVSVQGRKVKGCETKVVHISDVQFVE